MVDQTPKSVSAAVRKICSDIVSATEPVFVPVAPVPEAEIDDCFGVVAQLVAAHDGEAVYGWCIWSWPTIWFKAVHHAVWRHPDGQLVDPTPKRNKVSKILFLPDPSRGFDQKRRIDTVRSAGRPDRDIATLFEAEHRLYEYEERHSIEEGTRVRADIADYNALQLAQNAAYRKLLAKYLRPNDPCPCWSGKKAKKCHRTGDVWLRA